MTEPITRTANEVAGLTAALAAARAESAAAAQAIARDMRGVEGAITTAASSAGRAGRALGNAVGRVFDEVVLRGGKLSDVLKSVALDLSRTTLRAAFQPVEQAVSSAASNVIGSALQGLFGAAHGAAFAGGEIKRFARGGVVSGPTLFGYGQGRLGVMGEAGAEAVLPLGRDAQGRLGVRAEGGSRPVNVTFNVQTPNAESFRRSEGQIAAMLTRAVERGRRNL